MATQLNKPIISVLRDLFMARHARERRLILAMCSVVAVGLLWSWFSWQHKENERLDRALPQARARLASMQDASAEITRLRAQAKPAQIPTAQHIESLQASARTLQLNLNIRSIEGGMIQVSGNGVNFDAWISWLAQAQGTQSLRLANADIAQEANGVRIEAQLLASR